MDSIYFSLLLWMQVLCFVLLLWVQNTQCVDGLTHALQISFMKLYEAHDSNHRID